MLKFINVILLIMILSTFLFGIFLAAFYLIFQGETHEPEFYGNYVIFFLIFTFLAILFCLIVSGKIYHNKQVTFSAFLAFLLILIILSVTRFHFVLYAFTEKGNKSVRTQITEEDYIKLVNRWHYPLMEDDYALLSLIAQSALQDPVIDQMAEGVRESRGDTFPRKLESFAENNLMSHQFKGFADLPGQNPWGKTNLPVFRKLLPVEMVAMRRITGNISGDCAALSNMNLALCRKWGIPEENIFILRSRMHATLLLQYEGEVFIFESPEMHSIAATPVFVTEFTLFLYNIYCNTGFYNDRYYAKQGFVLNRKTLSGPGSLKEKLEKNYGIVFNDLHDMDKETLETSIAVCLQKKKQLSRVIRASVQGPLINNLTRELETPEKLLEWMNRNLTDAPIASDFVMTADQGIVFKGGSALDKAVLFLSFELIQKKDVALYSAGGETYLVKQNGRYIRFRDREITETAAPSSPLLLTYLLP